MRHDVDAFNSTGLEVMVISLKRVLLTVNTRLSVLNLSYHVLKSNSAIAAGYPDGRPRYLYLQY